jgi:hypothetical protein
MMARKKAPNQDKLLTKLVGVRLSPDVYDRLDKLRLTSDCQSVAELARRILSREKIVAFWVDRTMDATVEELCRIRREINSIGVNINQVTHAFHADDAPGRRVAEALKIVKQYNEIGDKVAELLGVISQVTKQWSPK